MREEELIVYKELEDGQILLGGLKLQLKAIPLSLRLQQRPAYLLQLFLGALGSLFGGLCLRAGQGALLLQTGALVTLLLQLSLYAFDPGGIILVNSFDILHHVLAVEAKRRRTNRCSVALISALLSSLRVIFLQTSVLFYHIPSLLASTFFPLAPMMPVLSPLFPGNFSLRH